MAGGQRPGPDLKIRQWPALEIGVVLVFALVIAASAFALGSLRSSSSATATPTGAAPIATPTAAPPMGLTAGSYMCGATGYLPDAHPATTAGIEGAPQEALNAAILKRPKILPSTGWQVWSGAADHYVFVAPSDKTQAPYAFVELRLAGTTWVTWAYGDCEPDASTSGFITAGWYLTKPLVAADTSLKMQFQLDFCRDELVGTTIWYTTTTVTATMWARPLDPATTTACASPSFVPAPFTLVLAEPLGTRQLLVGPATAAQPAGGTPTPPTPTKKPKPTKTPAY